MPNGLNEKEKKKIEKEMRQNLKNADRQQLIDLASYIGELLGEEQYYRQFIERVRPDDKDIVKHRLMGRLIGEDQQWEFETQFRLIMQRAEELDGVSSGQHTAGYLVQEMYKAAYDYGEEQARSQIRAAELDQFLPKRVYATKKKDPGPGSGGSGGVGGGNTPSGPSGRIDPGSSASPAWSHPSDVLYNLRQNESALTPLRVTPGSQTPTARHLKLLETFAPPAGNPRVPHALSGQVEAFVNGRWVPLEGVRGSAVAPTGSPFVNTPRIPISGAFGIAQVYGSMLDIIMRNPLDDIQYYQNLQEAGRHAVDEAKAYLKKYDPIHEEWPRDLDKWRFRENMNWPERHKRLTSAYNQLGNIAQRIFSKYGAESYGNMQFMHQLGLGSWAIGPLVDAVNLIDREGLREDLLSPQFRQMIRLTREMIGKPSRFSSILDSEVQGMAARMREGNKQAQALLKKVQGGERLTQEETQTLATLAQSANNLARQMHDWEKADQPRQLCETFAQLEEAEAKRLEAYARENYLLPSNTIWQGDAYTQAQEHRQRAASLRAGAQTLPRDTRTMVETIRQLERLTGTPMAALDTPSPVNLSYDGPATQPDGGFRPTTSTPSTTTSVPRTPGGTYHV